MKKFLLFPIITAIVVSSICADEISSKNEIVKKVRELNSEDRKKVLKMIQNLNTKTKIKTAVNEIANMGLAESLENRAKNFGKTLKGEDKSTFDEIYADVKKQFSKLNVDDRFDKSKFKDSFIIPYKKNYILPVVYDTNEHKYIQDGDGSRRAKNRKRFEAKMQISLLFPIYSNFLSTGGDLYYGYTAFSVWQIYNSETSAEFRDTNHQPELILHFNPNLELFNDIILSDILTAIIHQSNGQNIPNSRSWNRFNLEVKFKKDNFTFGTNFWYRWDEDKKSDKYDTQGDDNPDLEDYIGKANIYLNYQKNGYSFGIEHQNDPYRYNIKYGHTQLDFIFPSFNKNFKWYLQYFNGYGESLIDYNDRVNKIGIGVYINEWSI